MEEDDGGAVGADAGLARAEDGQAFGAAFGDGGVDVLDLETDVVLAALRVFGEEADDGGGVVIAARSARSGLLGRSTKQTFTPCAGRSNGSCRSTWRRGRRGTV
jgi:hypothetical protein